MDFRNECFIRTLLHPDDVKDGTVRAKAFRPAKDDIGHGISTYRNLPPIKDETGLQLFLNWASRNIRGTLGLCLLTRNQIESLSLNLVEDPNEPDDDARSKLYEPLHHLIRAPADTSPDKCPSIEQRKVLAMSATQNAYILIASEC